MTARRWRVFAVSFWVLALVGGVGGLVVLVVDPAPILPNTYGLGPAALVAMAVFGLSWATVGAILVFRVPANATGRCMVVVGAGFAMSVLTSAVTFAAMASGSADVTRLGPLAGWLTALTTSVIGLIFYVGFIFPTGRGHTPGWHRVAVACLWIDTVGAILVILQPGELHLFPGIDNPVGVGPDLRLLVGPRVVVGGALATTRSAIALVAAVVARYRAADTTVRQQLKWFMFAIVVALGGMAVLSLAVWAADGPVNETGLVVFGLAAAGAPIAIGIAILRYRLYEIDRIVSRTIGYVVVTGLLVTAYATVILLLQGPLGAVTGGDTISVALSTLVVAALFQPVRARVQRVVDRRFDRARFDADRTTTAFSERLRDEVDIETVTTDLRATVGRAIAPTSLAIWLRTGRTDR
jgi:hypothetical protein